MARPKRPYDTIGVAKFNPELEWHRRIVATRNAYRADMKEGVSLREFKDMFFACSACGQMNAFPWHTRRPCHFQCDCCGQFFYISKTFIRETSPPEDWKPEDPAQLSLLEQIERPP